MPSGGAATGGVLAARLAAKYPGRVTGTLLLPGQAGDYAPIPDDVPEALARALRSRGVDRLYKHQAEAWTASQAGRHLVVATPTASPTASRSCTSPRSNDSPAAPAAHQHSSEGTVT